MELRQLKHFIQLAKVLNMTEASKQLYISQQGLSKSILSLEKDLGCQLFNRTNNRLSLTEAGTIFYKHAEKILLDCNMMQNDLKPFKEENHLFIACATGSAQCLMKELISPFLKRNPDIKITIEEKDNALCYEQLISKEISIMAGIYDPDQMNNVISYSLYREPLGLILPSDHPLAKKKRLHIKDLNNMSLITYKDSCMEIFKGILNKKGIQLANIQMMGDIMSVYETCVTTHQCGLTLYRLSRYMKDPHFVMIPFDQKEIGWDISLILNKDKNMSQCEKNLIKFFETNKQ